MAWPICRSKIKTPPSNLRLTTHKGRLLIFVSRIRKVWQPLNHRFASKHKLILNERAQLDALWIQVLLLCCREKQAIDGCWIWQLKVTIPTMLMAVIKWPARKLTNLKRILKSKSTWKTLGRRLKSKRKQARKRSLKFQTQSSWKGSIRLSL